MNFLLGGRMEDKKLIVQIETAGLEKIEQDIERITKKAQTLISLIDFMEDRLKEVVEMYGDVNI